MVKSFNTYAFNKNNETLIKIKKQNNIKFMEHITKIQERVIKLIKDKSNNDEINYESFLDSSEITLRLAKYHTIATKNKKEEFFKIDNKLDLTKIIPVHGILNFIMYPIIQFKQDKYEIVYIVTHIGITYDDYMQ